MQVPLHLYQPSIDSCKLAVDSGIKLIGKLVLPKGMNDVPTERFENLFNRYKGLITIWDFGGEPETTADLPGCRFNGTPLELTKQMQSFYKIGKAVDPTNTIGGCGWITPTFNGHFGNGDRSWFLSQCLSYGIGDSLDFVSLNFYLYGYGGTKNVLAGMGKINELLAWHHVDKPIVVSESGVPCSGDPKFLHIIQTPERQAYSLVEQTVLFSSLGIDYSVWFALQYEGWGLLDEQGNERPSYKVMQTLMSMLRGTVYVEQIKALPSRSVEERWLTDKVQWHLFQKYGVDIHVFWITGGGSTTRKIPKDVKIYNMYGEEDPGDWMIQVDRYPKYMVTEPDQVGQKDFFLG